MKKANRSWSTEGQKNVDTDADNTVVPDGSIAINPPDRKRDDTCVSASEDLRSLDTNMGEQHIRFVH